MVARLHEHGIEVILDVVYNHTAEADELGPDDQLPRPGQRQLLPAAARPQVSLREPHRLRQHAGPAPSACTAAGARQPALLGRRDACRRLPFRPRTGARPRRPWLRPPCALLHRAGAGPAAVALEDDRRALGHRPRRLPARRLPRRLAGMERPLPRHHARLLDRGCLHARRFRAAAVCVVRHLPAAPPCAGGVGQLRGLARRLHAARPGELRAQAQPRQRREQSRRPRPQPQRQLRRRGADGRCGGECTARPHRARAAGQHAALAGHADARRRRRTRPQPGRQQQPLLPGQRDDLDRLVACRRRPARLHREAARAAPAGAALRRPLVRRPGRPARPAGRDLAACGRQRTARRRVAPTERARVRLPDRPSRAAQARRCCCWSMATPATSTSCCPAGSGRRCSTARMRAAKRRGRARASVLYPLPGRAVLVFAAFGHDLRL